MNRKLSAVGAFYTHAAGTGSTVGELLASWQVGGARGGWKPFLHHISKSAPKRRRVIALKTPKKLPRVLSPAEVQAILDGCDRLRDRLLFAVLSTPGCGSVRRSGCGTTISLPPSVRCGAAARQRQRRARQVARPTADPGQQRAGPVVSPTTCTPSTATWTATTCSSTCGPAARASADLRRGLRAGAAAAPRDRDRLRPALAAAHRRDPTAPRRRRHRGGGAPARTCERRHDDHDLRAPDRGGRSAGDETGGLVQRAGRCGCDRAIAETCRSVGAAGQADGRGAQRIPQRCNGIRGEDRCSAEPSAGWRSAGEPRADAACAKDIGSGGTIRDAQTWSGSSDRPIRGGGGNNRTNSAGYRVAVTAPRAAVCVACMPSDGNAPAAAIWTRGWPIHNRSSNPLRVRPAASRTAGCGRRRTSPFCQTHTNTWKVNGRPDVDEFADHFAGGDHTGQRDDSARPADPAAEAGNAVRAATPPLRSTGQAHPGCGHARGARARRREGRLSARPRRGLPGPSELG